MVAYCFAGRNTHQTLGMLYRRMEREGYGPLGFVATDYAIAVWSRHDVPTQKSCSQQIFWEMIGRMDGWILYIKKLRRSPLLPD